MKSTHSMVISMRLPAESGKRLKRMANRHGWTPSDASARLVEEGLRRSEFGFIDFRDSTAGRQACLQGSTLAVWEVMLLVRSYKNDVSAVADNKRDLQFEIYRQNLKDQFIQSGKLKLNEAGMKQYLASYQGQ